MFHHPIRKDVDFKKKTLWVLLSAAFCWLAICQGIFYFIQENQSLALERSLQNQFREELRASNFLYLSRVIADLDENRTIRCAHLVKREEGHDRPILDLRFKPGCGDVGSEFLLGGALVRRELVAINGDVYVLNFRTVNSSLFDGALWLLRLSGLFILMLVTLVFRAQRRQHLILVESEKRVAQAKVDVARQVAHDIRSPLSAIRMILASPESPEKAEILKAAARRVGEIADDLMLLSARQERVTEAVAAYDLAEPLREVIEEKKASLEPGRASVRADVPAVPVPGNIIEKKDLKRVVSNLVNNAVEAGEGREVHVTVSLRDFPAHVEISVSDDGRGIPAEILGRIGERGFSFGKSGLRDAGSGLGIHHAKSAVEAAGGKVNITSKVGLGTIVQIVLPKI